MQSEKFEGNITIEFDARIYSEQAVKSAIYDFNIAARISLKEDDKEIILVILQSPVDSRSSIEEQIYKSVLDHQVRIDVEKELLGSEARRTASILNSLSYRFPIMTSLLQLQTS